MFYIRNYDKRDASLEEENQLLQQELAEKEVEMEILYEDIYEKEIENECLVSKLMEEDKESDMGDTEGPYYASEQRKLFHRPDCKWAQEIPQSNLRIFNHREEAIAAGLKTCKTCNS